MSSFSLAVTENGTFIEPGIFLIDRSVNSYIAGTFLFVVYLIHSHSINDLFRIESNC